MKEINCFEMFKDALEERNLTIKSLENNGILRKGTFYNFSTYCPSLTNAIKIANFLEMSLDYILGRTDINSFRKYKENQSNFYKLYKNTLKLYHISNYKLTKAINIAENNIIKWKNGATPKFSTIIMIAEYLNCSIDDLLEKE